MRIQRSWPDTLLCASLALGSGAGTYYAHAWAAGARGLVWLFAWILTVFAGIAALGFAWVAARESGRASCPGCGTTLSGLDAKVAFRAVECTQCHEYVACRRGVLSMVAHDFVADEPLFGSPLPQNVQWPDGCCVCGASATRMVTFEHHETQTGRNLALGAAGLAVGVLAVRTGGGSTWRIEVPHCDAHNDGAKLEKGDDSATELRLRFRSYGYFRSFRDLNVGQRV